MSHTKHLADLLKVCSILPALLIMPAMAEMENVTERVVLTSDKVYQADVLAKDVVGSQGGVFYVDKDLSLIFQDDASFIGNVAQGKNVHGGAIYNMGNVVFNDDARFVGNKTYSSGGAIRNLADAQMVFNGDAEFDGNLVLYSKDYSAAANGAAINNSGKIVFNGDVAFKNNSALDRKDAYSQGGAIYNNGEIEFNGAVLFTGNESFNKGSVIENTATGKISFAQGIVVDGNGGDSASLSGSSSNGIDNGGILTISGGDAIFTNNHTSGIAGISTGGVLTINAGKSGQILFENNTARDSIVGLYSSGSDTTLSADLISFKNNIQTSDTAKVYGGAVYNGGSGQDQGVLNLLAKNIVFEGNQVNGFQSGNKKIGGGALYNRGGGNSASVTETVIGLADGSSIITFKNNSAAQHGGAIFSRTDDGAGYDSLITLTGDVEFYGNRAGENGGAIMNWTDGSGGQTDIQIIGKASFENNTAGQDGGAIFNSGTLDLSNAVVEFEENIATGSGGAVYNTGNLTIKNTEFEDNKVIGGFGDGGALWSNTGALKLVNTDFENNNALANAADDYGYGGAIFVQGGTFDVQGGRFVGNNALTSGAVYISRHTSSVTMQDVVFENNWASDIAALGVFGKNTTLTNLTFKNNYTTGEFADYNDGGGALFFGAEAQAVLDKGLFVANKSASVGGAIATRSPDKGSNIAAKLDIKNSIFTENVAATKGGAIYTAFYNSQAAVDFVYVTDTVFSANKAIDGGAIYNEGLADRGDNYATIKLNNVVFQNNNAYSQGGAIYNGAGGTVALSGNNLFNGNTAGKYGAANDIYNLGYLNIVDGKTVLAGGVSGSGTFTLGADATLDIGSATIQQGVVDLQGTVIASLVNNARGNGYGHFVGDVIVGENAKFELNVGAVGTYNIWNGAAVSLDQVAVGDIYEIVSVDGNGVTVATKSVADIAEKVGVSVQAAGAVASLANTTSNKAHRVSLALQEALNAGDAAYVEAETAKLNPTDKPVAQAATTSVQNQVLSLASGRMSGGMSVGRSGGDEYAQENGFWIQGLFNKSKFADQFHGYTRGVALGADTLIDRKWTIGGGLAFNGSDVHARDGAHTSIDTKTLFLYGQYKPSKWFMNATATYSMSEYTENKTVAGVGLGATYDVDAYGAQFMTGYDFATGITTQAGMRYLHIAQDSYIDDRDAQIMATDTDFMSGVAGLKYAFAIENDWAIQIRPELSASVTYDFVSDDSAATVVTPGVEAYAVNGNRLSRIGGEFGIGFTAQYKGVEMSLMYDLDLHKDYTSQTGMLKLRAQF